MTVVMVHSNPLRVSDGKLTVDRKFHTGMLQYAQRLGCPIVTVNPNLREGQAIMDAIEIPLTSLPYEVLVDDGDEGRIRRRMAGCSIVYGIGSATLAQSVGAPYIQILEYDLDTQLRIISTESSGLRRAVRSLRCVRHYLSSSVPEMKGARSLHCNGFPMFHASAKHNASRLLFFDSRMKAEDVIQKEALEDRLATLPLRPLRLFYSGRYERMKGADDVVRVAIECLQRGMRVELDCYGQGSLFPKMRAIAAGYGSIRIHEAIPYPELVKASRDADLFVCCHIQSDPSCTYLESMGSGLPIVGYRNRMWIPLQQASNAGLVARRNSVSAVADLIERVQKDGALPRLSLNAREFALEHSFEREFEKRVNALRDALGVQQLAA